MRIGQSKSSRRRKDARGSQTRGQARKPRGSKGRARARQGELAFRSWGGARPGAGRKPKGERAMLPHRPRPDHTARFPVLVTTRLRPGLPSLRKPGEAARVRAALAIVNEAAEQVREENGRKSAPFQVVHHSIQSNHLHLIVEAQDRRALTRGVQGLLVRIARALNRLWQRRGSVFSDRFHERELLKPRQVRNALVYVLQNLRKHGIHLARPDPYSSAPEFEGWSTGRPRLRGSGGGARPTRMGGDPLPELRSLRRAMRVSIPSAQTWLLGVGWRRHGPLDPREGPVSR